MAVGNRCTLSFDHKKIKALQVKNHNILYGTSVAPKAPAPKKSAKPRAVKPKPKPKSPSERSGSESDSESSSSSADSDEDGIISEGNLTPVLVPTSVPGTYSPGLPGNQAAADSLFQETISALED